MNKQQFINSIEDDAREGYRKHRILPSLVIAQAILESGWGRSDLSTKANNLFGIKANYDFRGEKILSSTKEFVNGNWINTKAYFRKYKTLSDSILDHTIFLNSPRYNKVRQSKDYKQACEEIFKAGYATDPNYPEKLITIIEENKLYKYDKNVRSDYMDKVVLDPGHGGTDPGGTGNGYKEKDLTLKLCLDIEKEVKKHKIEVHLTRRNDVFMALEKRSQLANHLKADAFLSIHFNSATNNNAKGLETFNYPSSKEGNELATKIQSELVNAKLCLVSRGVKQASFSVLRRTNMPASLLEVCFINNKEDIEFFIKNYDKYVQIITKSIVEYFNIKYIGHNKDTVGPLKPSINIAKDKVNILLLSDHVVIDGFIKEGITYVNINKSYISIREVLENLGLTVDWNKDLKVITADINKEYKSDKDCTDILLLGSKINVKTYVHQKKNCLKIGGAYIPIRDIFEQLGFKVSWDSKSSLVIVE